MPYAPSQVLAKIIQEVEVDLRLRNAKTLDYLASKGRVKAATSSELNWNVVVSDSATATVAMTTAGVDQNTGDTIQAKLGIGAYKIYHQFAVNRVDLKDAQARGTKAIKQLFAFNVKAGIRSIRKQVNNYIWNATGSAPFGGFVGFTSVLDNTAVYANIDPATYTNWVTIKNANAGVARPLTRSIIYDFNRVVLDEQELNYDCIWASPKTSQVYQTLFDTITATNSIPNVLTRDTTDLAPGARYWDGIPIRTDRNMADGQIVTFDSDTVTLMSFDLSDADQGQLTSYGLKDNFGTIGVAEVGGLLINVALLPQTNPGTLQFQMFVVPQMKVENRRLVQAITDITVP